MANVLVVNTRIEEVSDRPIQAQGAVRFDLAAGHLLPGTTIDATCTCSRSTSSRPRNHNMALTEMTARAVPRIRAMLDRGFTSVRDVAGDVGIRDAIAQGFIPGPRLFVGGPAYGTRSADMATTAA